MEEETKIQSMDKPQKLSRSQKKKAKKRAAAAAGWEDFWRLWDKSGLFSEFDDIFWHPPWFGSIG